MKVLIGYDGSESADAAVTAAGKLLAGAEAVAVVVSVWEPMLVSAMHAARFGRLAWLWTVASDGTDADDRSEQHARKLAEHGAQLADTLGFNATAVWVADDRDVQGAILGEASKSDVDLVVLGARGLSGIRAFLGSVSNHVLQHSSRPVLVIPTGAEAG
jgi:nucleotide-binding universal stress UspA family protein